MDNFWWNGNVNIAITGMTAEENQWSQGLKGSVEATTLMNEARQVDTELVSAYEPELSI